MDLTVGKLGDALEDMASEGCAKLNLRFADEWRRIPENITTVSLLNLASVGLFLDHVRQLPGFSEARFRNLPWWENSIWLPVEFTPPEEPIIQENGWSIFLGSSRRLIAELEDIRGVSPVRLGNRPPGYDMMRSDLKGFYRSEFSLTEDDIILQWVWRGLYDAAEIANREGAPIWGMS